MEAEGGWVFESALNNLAGRAQESEQDHYLINMIIYIHRSITPGNHMIEPYRLP